jgi:hypothetical protein
VSNEIYRLERLQRKQHYSPGLAELTRIRDDLSGQLAAAVAREDEALVALYSSAEGTRGRLDSMQGQLDEAGRRYDELMLTLYLRRFSRSDLVSLGVFSEDPDTLLELAGAYFTIAGSSLARVSVWQFTPPRAGREAPIGPERRVLLTGSDAFAGRPTVVVRLWDAERRAFQAEAVTVQTMKGVIGIGLEIQGRAAFPRFGAEAGLHTLQTTKKTTRALVSGGDMAMTEYQPPEGIERRGTIGSQPRRRHSRLEAGTIEDDRLGTLTMQNKSFPEMLATCIEEALRLAAREVLTS